MSLQIVRNMLQEKNWNFDNLLQGILIFTEESKKAI